MKDEDLPEASHKEKKATSGGFTFRLRVALRSNPSTQQGTDEEDEADDDGEEAEMEEKRRGKRGVKRAGEPFLPKKMRRVKFEGEETAVTPPSPPEERGSDSAEDVPESFLSKREQNIKANKAMVNRKRSIKLTDWCIKREDPTERPILRLYFGLALFMHLFNLRLLLLHHTGQNIRLKNDHCYCVTVLNGTTAYSKILLFPDSWLS